MPTEKYVIFVDRRRDTSPEELRLYIQRAIEHYWPYSDDPDACKFATDNVEVKWIAKQTRNTKRKKI